MLDGTAAEAWRGELEQHVMRGLPRLNEVVFYHKKSRALIVTDLVFNITRSASSLEKLLLRLNGAYRHFGPTRLFNTFFIKDKAARKNSAVPLIGCLERGLATPFASAPAQSSPWRALVFDR